MLRTKLIGAALLIAALNPAIAEEHCQLTLSNANDCTFLNWKPMPEPYQWLKPFSRPVPGDHYSEYIQQTAAVQFVGVMTDLQFINRHCPNIVRIIRCRRDDAYSRHSSVGHRQWKVQRRDCGEARTL